jgi:hypothetical protein
VPGRADSGSPAGTREGPAEGGPGPARRPPPRNTALDTARKDPGTTKRILELGGTVPREAEAGPAALQALVAREVARWTAVLRSAVDANP